MSGKPVEVYAIFGGQWPHSSFMVPGGVMCAPTLSDVTRSIAILEHWRDNWLENTGSAAASTAGWRTPAGTTCSPGWTRTSHSTTATAGSSSATASTSGSTSLAQGVGNYFATGTYLHPDLYQNPTIEGRNAALINRSGIYADGEYHDFDHMLVR